MPDRLTGKKLLVIDMDGTLTLQDTGMDYVNALPRQETIDKVNALWLSGDWHVTIFTARGMQQFRGDLEKIEAFYRGITEAWLEKYRVYHDDLRFGKPSADLYVDDKNWSINEFVAANL